MRGLSLIHIYTLREFDCHSELSYFTNELILVTNDEGTSLINRLGTDIIEPERKFFIDSERGCNVYEQLIIVKDLSIIHIFGGREARLHGAGRV